MSHASNQNEGRRSWRRRPLATRLAQAGLLFASAWSFPAHAAVYRGCAAPPSSYSRHLIANATNYATVLAKARSGDAVYLVSGNYGAAQISGDNPGFITVAAAPGQTPVFSSLKVHGSRWVLRGLTVVGDSPPYLYGPGRAHLPLVVISAGDNIIFENNVVASGLGPYPWREELLPGQADKATIRDQPAPSDGIHVNQSSCVAITGNRILNVFNGMQVGGDQQQNHGRFFVISDNLIDSFAGDGIDHSVSDAIISRNLIRNVRNTCQQKCIHSDGIQGWTYADRPGVTNSHVLIDANRIYARMGPPMPFSDGPLQGVTIFDGSWKDVKVTNNVIVNTVYQAIGIGGVDGLVVVNNTVAAMTNLPAWIVVGGDTREGGQADHQIVKNNVATKIVILKAGGGRHMTADHNLTSVDPISEFDRFDVAHGQFDLHLRAKGAAAQGDRNVAPITDIDGKPRSGPVMLGAYQ
jgi:hypothetical protein